MKLLIAVRELALGPRDDQGKIQPARPTIIIGATVVVLAVLTWLTNGYIWVVVLLVVLWGGLGLVARKDTLKAKRVERILEVLAGSAVTSTYDVARHTGFDLAEVEAIIAEQIKSANMGRKAPSDGLKFLRNAKLDVLAHKVTLDPQATASRASKLGASASAVLDRFAPVREEPKPDWNCGFCRSTNRGETTSCEKCGAGRVA